jgi:selenoprotein W-related protein
MSGTRYPLVLREAQDERNEAPRMNEAPRVEIEYCRRCKFLLRASWMAQELLSTFEEELGGVTLVPGGGGIFEVRVDGEVIASNREGEEMPEPGAVKRALRDRIAPGRRIGHDSDDAGGSGAATARR